MEHEPEQGGSGVPRMLAAVHMSLLFPIALFALPTLVLFLPMCITFFVAHAIGLGWGALVAALLAGLATMLVRPNGAMAQGVLAVMLFLGLWGLAIVLAVAALLRWVF